MNILSVNADLCIIYTRKMSFVLPPKPSILRPYHMKHQKKKIKMCVTPKNTSKFNHPFGGPFPMKYQKVAINGILLL